MPQYHYKHDQCGMDQDFFLRQNVETKQVNCYRCGLLVTARQVHDNSTQIAEADGTIGLIKHTIRPKHEIRNPRQQ